MHVLILAVNQLLINESRVFIETPRSCLKHTGWDTKKLCEFSAERAMQWKFATPASPHQKGCAEALVKSCELQTSLGLSISCSATFEQLFRFGATFSPSSNFSDFVQLFSFLNNCLAFLRQFVTKNRPFKF